MLTPVEECKKVLGTVVISFDEFLITRRIGVEITLHSRSFGNVHISLYSTFDRRTALCKYTSWRLVRRLLRSLLAKS